VNALAGERSPYLRQHADNPVDWLPWGAEALARARARDAPLFVSIGYAACHWCHVMERESFTDETIAELMNERFVCVKVDREERPDLDGIYMQAVQLMTGHGGWPLNVFLTPDQAPFFGGTYWPPTPHHGMPSFAQVLNAVADMWQTQREEAVGAGAALTKHLREQSAMQHAEAELHPELLERAVAGLLESYDPLHAGFGGAPKFPPHCVLDLLLRRGALDAAVATLLAMASGGIFDQVGGGFARYAVDRTWTVPHFEKMLYDNALCARNYLHGWQLTGSRCCCAPVARHSTSACASYALLTAASTARSTRTPLESKAATTSGRWPSCAKRSAVSRTRRSPTSARARPATSRAPTSCAPTDRSPHSGMRSAGCCTRCASGGLGLPSTTSR